MSWQEELRKLDEELAAGQISADDYRVRRDQVLSSAVSFGPAGQSPKADKAQETQLIPTGPPAPPPPPQAQGGPDKTQIVGNQADADKTQIVPGDQADRTQAVGGWQTARPSDADRTQVVPGVPPQTYAGGQPPRPAPGQGSFPPAPGFPPPMGWQQQPEEDLGSPWGGAEFPPLTPAGGMDWIRQGPEVFETDRKSKTGKVLAIVAIVLLLAGLGVGGYFLLRNKGDNPAQPPATTASAPETTKPSPKPTTSTPPPRPVVTPPGSVLVDSTYTLQRLGEVKILSPEDFEIFNRNQITEAQVQVTKEGELTRGTWAFTAPDRAAAEKILKEIDTLYRQVNFKPAPDITTENVSALYFTPPAGGGPTVYRAHYLAGNKVVRVESYGPDAALVATELVTLLDAQLQRLPASG